MNSLTGEKLLKLDHIRDQIEARDRELINRYSKDAQVMAIHNARAYIGDRLTRAVPCIQCWKLPMVHSLQSNFIF